ncbi:GntR family transcriptional regulator [Tropicibacter naphthalenivorans]|uniref:Putative HTH-type transcriptional regulator YdfH n=1 Tax=Tropicibacter naphthalenivorans TaxID=441103 RepID=A0A0P1GGW9_9RHOB|nr:GntR family transcriptional regulator [Tropicibacter naphthalenivorans]CUH80862.1 putative HTH-type transcriptional regulator YdfH [Tropicibacter naphthalenivorans]SMC90721.1 transcriptional regulator, GntR family [Tropicibacter naphthalenivorans]
MVLDGQDRWRLNNALPISSQIYALLRDRIVRNEFAPGERISEAEIAKLCEVSRQPVREAFIKLAGENLLEIRPQRGTIITKIAYTAVLDARFLREAIEADIVSILASRSDTALVRELRDQVSRQRELGQSRSAEFIQLDEHFHHTLAQEAGKGGAWKLLEGLKSQMDRVRFLSLSQFPIGRLVAQHSALVDRIERGDVSGANAAIRTHLREVLTDLPSILAANPQFFDLPDGTVLQPANAPIQGGIDHEH